MSKETKDFRVIICGPRDFKDYEFLKSKCDTILSRKLKDPEFKVIIVSGGSPGAERLGEKYAKDNNIVLEVFPANFDKYGNKAGSIRNRQMAEKSNACIIFEPSLSAGEEKPSYIKSILSLSHSNKLLIREVKIDKS